MKNSAPRIPSWPELKSSSKPRNGSNVPINPWAINNRLALSNNEPIGKNAFITARRPLD